MTLKMLALCAAVSSLAASAAQAREVYDDLFFVRAHASASDLFQDRDACRTAASHMNDTAASYSNPEYGALSAMGSALDEYSLHDGGLRKRLERAVFDHCMKDKGWTPATPQGEDLKVLLRATPRRPQAIDAWLKTHEPTPAAEADPVVKTAASAQPATKN